MPKWPIFSTKWQKLEISQRISSQHYYSFTETRKGLIENLRPITLLSILRKTLAICIKQRIIDRLDAWIPNSQAAYRTGRSTTEHVFTAKILCEKAITSKDNPMNLLMLDMSKAFDTINRQMLIEKLAETINDDELHVISIMLNTILQVRVGERTKRLFHYQHRSTSR